jgi:single-strand DNA-binding protein
MGSYNTCTIVGNLGGDVVTREAGGKSIASFSVAVNEKRGGKDETTWFRVTAWEKLADICSRYLSKGSQVLVEGRIKLNEYIDKQGAAKASLELTANKVVFLGGKGEGGGSGGTRRTDPGDVGGPPPMDPAGGSDDIPFARPPSRAVTEVGGHEWRRAAWRQF